MPYGQVPRAVHVSVLPGPDHGRGDNAGCQPAAKSRCPAAARFSFSAAGRAIKIMNTIDAIMDKRLDRARKAADEPGSAEEFAREADRLFDELSAPRKLPDGRKVLPHMHRARQVPAHLEKMEEQLQSFARELEAAEFKRILGWVERQPVLGELARVVKEPLPKEAYLLLFRAGEGNAPALVTAESGEGRVFTRFHPEELSDEVRLYKKFHGQPPIVGAALIAEKELLLVLGLVPEAGVGQQQLEALLSLSRGAAGRPAKDFLEQNPVLKELHELAHRRKIPKQAFVLLFHGAGQGACVPELEMLSKTSSEGKIITRFWPVEFSDKQKLMDAFRSRPPIAGAAVIHESELLHVFGLVPQPAEGESQLQVLLSRSSEMRQRPSLDFLDAREVLKGLHEYARNASPDRQAYVLLFKQAAGGRLEMMSLKSARAQSRVQIPLAMFRAARDIHERFSSEPEVVGASVVSAEQRPAKPRPAGRTQEDTAVRPPRRGQAAPVRSVVLASFGKTPLKTGHLATKETLQRLGIELP